MVNFVRGASKLKHASWELMRSPKLIAFLKLGAAVVGVIHALEELRESSATGKIRMGFRPDNED